MTVLYQIWTALALLSIIGAVFYCIINAVICHQRAKRYKMLDSKILHFVDLENGKTIVSNFSSDEILSYVAKFGPEMCCSVFPNFDKSEDLHEVPGMQSEFMLMRGHFLGKSAVFEDAQRFEENISEHSEDGDVE